MIYLIPIHSPEELAQGMRVYFYHHGPAELRVAVTLKEICNGT